MPNPEAMSPGERHNELVALNFSHMHPRYGRMWRFRCDCGAEAVMLATNVRSGRAKTCGHARLGAPGPRKSHATLAEALRANLPGPRPDGCWPWAGMIGTDGYGRVFFRSGRPILAHRAAWEVFKGPIPAGLHVLHTCDNRPCCNPGHLFLGQDRENVDDKVAKRRHNFGEGVPQARLTNDQARQIRDAKGKLHRELATEFGVSLTTISNIRSGKAWKLALG